MTRRSSFPRKSDDRAAAGTVAGLIMLGAIVAFLAYMNVAWVPAWVESKEANHADDVSRAISNWASDAEDRIGRAQTGRAWTEQFPLGVSGLAILGTGSSSGELTTDNAPNLTITQGSTLILYAEGGLSMSTHTQRYPNQTYRYALGAMQTSQSDGTYVDLRSLITVNRTTSGKLSLAIQAVNMSSTPQQAGGNGEATATGKVVSIDSTSGSAGSVVMTAQNVAGGAWRAALNRTFTANGLAGETAASCAASTKDYCYVAGSNSATTASVTLLNVKSGWTAQNALVAAELRS